MKRECKRKLQIGKFTATQLHTSRQPLLSMLDTYKSIAAYSRSLCFLTYNAEDTFTLKVLPCYKPLYRSF